MKKGVVVNVNKRKLLLCPSSQERNLRIKAMRKKFLTAVCGVFQAELKSQLFLLLLLKQ